MKKSIIFTFVVLEITVFETLIAPDLDCHDAAFGLWLAIFGLISTIAIYFGTNLFEEKKITSVKTKPTSDTHSFGVVVEDDFDAWLEAEIAKEKKRKEAN